MKKIKLFTLMAILVFGMIMLVGCEEETPAVQDPAQQGNVAPVANNDPAVDEGDTRVMTDQAGRQVELAKEVNRVITTWRPSTSLLFAIGGQEKLVAADTHSTKNEFLLGVYPEIGNIPGIGNRKGLNLEEMVAAKPDVVFIWQGTDTEPVIKQLEQQGIAVFVLVPESQDDMKEATRLMGEIIGHQEQAEAAIAYYDNTVKMIVDKLAGVAKEDLPVAFMAGSGGLLNTVGGEYYQHFLIENAGGKNAAAELKGFGWQDISAEQMVTWNPEYIFATQFFDADLAEAVKSQAGLQNVKAVQEGKVYKFPANITSWDFPEPLSALGILWMAKTMHPDVFADLDFNAEVENYHKKFFGKTFTELGGNLDESAPITIK